MLHVYFCSLLLPHALNLLIYISDKCDEILPLYVCHVITHVHGLMFMLMFVSGSVYSDMQFIHLFNNNL